MLSDIKQFAREIVGLPESDDALLRYINRAAQELYDSHDLPNSLWEAFFTFGTQTQLITLPWYVGDIRGVRRHQYSNKIQVVDSRPRYHYSPWVQPLDQWRIIGNTPLTVSQTQAGTLTVTIAVAESTAFTVRIRGQTTTASIASETLTFPAGATSQTTTIQFTQPAPFGIVAITKSRKTLTDVTITQSSDALEIARIPNCMLEASNRLLQVHDGEFNTAFGTDELVEVLFKWPFIPLDADEDMFLGTNRYDQAVVWKLREIWHSTRKGEEEIAMLAAAKCRDLMSSLARTQEATIEKTILETPNPYEMAPLSRPGASNRYVRA